MTNVTIELTEAQEKYLKKFYNNHHSGAKDNLATYMPIHVVESINYTYVPYTMLLNDYSINGHLCFYESDCCHTYNDIDSLTDDWNENTDEKDNIPYYSEVKGTEVNNIYVYSEEDYINVYGIENIELLYAIENYRPIAFFFIREEAKRYIKYQLHNLKSPRVYTYSSGYSNCGEYEHFYALLQNMGQILTNKDK